MKDQEPNNRGHDHFTDLVDRLKHGCTPLTVRAKGVHGPNHSYDEEVKIRERKIGLCGQSKKTCSNRAEEKLPGKPSGTRWQIGIFLEQVRCDRVREHQ